MDALTALFDACVLYPAQLRSLLMYLALTDLFAAKWTNNIHAEWMRSVQRDYPDLRREQIDRVRHLMDSHVPEALVTHFESLIPTLALPDPDDCHVLAAAIHCDADIILTYNLDDFPAAALDQFEIEAQHPDDFIMRLIQADSRVVCAAAKRHRESLKNPPKTVDEYLATLERQSLIQTVAALRQLIDLI